ncbi:hypothetical protein P7K49_031673, partial [Saguinus oedipus]
DFTGYWKMLANENFEEYLRALGKRCPPRPGRRSPEPSVAAALLPLPRRAAVQCFWTPKKGVLRYQGSQQRAPGLLYLGNGSVSLPANSAALSARKPPAPRRPNLLKPDKEIVQDGDHMIIRTLSTFRNYIMDFQVGKEFEEDLTGIDDRKCMVRIRGLGYFI